MQNCVRKVVPQYSSVIRIAHIKEHLIGYKKTMATTKDEAISDEDYTAGLIGIHS